MTLLLLFGHPSADCLSAQVGAKAAILANLGTGNILYEYNPDMQIPPASLAKLMTMLLTLDSIKAKKLSYEQKLTVGREAAQAGGSAMQLYAGEQVPVVRLLAGTAVASGNDAATVLATGVGGSQKAFVARMNSRAKQLGMTRTTFKNPTGLPAPGQKTTARDLLKLCRAYLKAHPDANRFHSMKYFMHKGRIIRNTNPLLGGISGVNGLKTGWTIASGYNLIITAKRGNIKLLIIILGADSRKSRDALALKLIEAGFAHPDNPAKAKNYMIGTGK